MIIQWRNFEMSQTERLKNYLETIGSINPLQAWQVLGIYRLAARISDVKSLGVNVASETIKVKNQFGEECRVASYFIRKT
jgi:hypothetical protein